MRAVQSKWAAAREYVSPVLRESKFYEHGRITPEEFVIAGDYLAQHHPPWHWCAGDPSRARDYLPHVKQYLMIRAVPCLHRISHVKEKKRHGMLRLSRNSSSTSLSRLDKDSQAFGGTSDMTERIVHANDSKDSDDPWILTHSEPVESVEPMHHDPTLQDLSSRLLHLGGRDAASGSEPSSSRVSSVIDEESEVGTPQRSRRPSEMVHASDADVDLLHSFAEGMEEREDPAQFLAPPSWTRASDGHTASESTVLVRTYDCMITYDKYYQTPRLWLMGYDEHGLPLRSAAIFEDVAADHAFKTVTIEPFPHGQPGVTSSKGSMSPRLSSRAPLSVHVASIHPCRHASMMRRMIDHISHERDSASKPFLTSDETASREPLWKQTMQRMWGPKPRQAQGALTVDHYLVVFLRFMTSIVPTIDFDTRAPSDVRS